MGQLRDRVLDAAHLARHSLVLDLKAGSGLLTWEALRRVPEGGVYALARNERDAGALGQLAARLPEVERPILMVGDLADLPALLAKTMTQATGRLSFDAIVAHNGLMDCAGKAAAVTLLRQILADGGVVSLAERIPRHTQRLYRLADLSELDDDLVGRMVAAEDAIYTQANDPLVNWDADDFTALWPAAGFTVASAAEDESSEVRITAGLLERWFAPTGDDRPSYAQHLAAQLSPPEIDQVREIFRRQLLNQTVWWRSRVLFLTAQLVK